MPTLSTTELDEIYEFAINLAKDSGNLLQRAANTRINGNGGQNLAVAVKVNDVDIVTETDEGVYS
jgi:hypothetical protein